MSIIGYYLTIFFALHIMYARGLLLPEYLPGIPEYDVHTSSLVPSSFHNLTTSPAPIHCTNGSRLDCEGCHRQIVCDYDGNILARVNCPPTRPYCSKIHGQCIAIPPKECFPFMNFSSEKKSELCPSSGFFPHPLHCNKFQLCTLELQAFPYVCPHYYIYDPVSHLCRLYRNSQDCPILDCHRFPNRFVSYALDRTLYLFCNIDMDGNVRLLLYQCTGETVFNAEKQGCEFGCVEGEGRFEYPGDKSKFYLCLMTNYGEIVPFIMSCNAGSHFESGKCKLKELNLTVTTESSISNTMQHVIAFVPITVPMMKNYSNSG